jgi:diguanylate cyclase (GGDEF)-like protein
MLDCLWPKSFLQNTHARPFLVSLCLFLSLVVAGIFFFLYTQTNNLLIQRVREQAITYSDLIMHTKSWNFDYGGVYVEKKRGTESNIYLKQLGINPDVQAESGRVFTVRNHAIMIDEISRLSERRDGTRFRNVSLTPLNPSNTPDSFEQAALGAFNGNAREYYRIQRTNGQPPVFRYALPLYTEQTCLECHSNGINKIGSVLGVTSISIPMATLEKETGRNRLITIAAATVTIGLLIAVVCLLTWKLMIRLDETQKHLMVMATTDSLTGLANRRQIMKRLDEEYERSSRQGTPLCVATLDIDHFKQINDTYGHPFGDQVLREIAQRMQQSVRRYDIVGRIGGEEFLVVSPGSSLQDTVTMTERLREDVSSSGISMGTSTVHVTISAGVALLGPADNSVGSILKRADTALYKAKHSGRNRVVSAE